MLFNKTTALLNKKDKEKRGQKRPQNLGFCSVNSKYLLVNITPLLHIQANQLCHIPKVRKVYRDFPTRHPNPRSFWIVDSLKSLLFLNVYVVYPLSLSAVITSILYFSIVKSPFHYSEYILPQNIHEIKCTYCTKICTQIRV